MPSAAARRASAARSARYSPSPAGHADRTVFRKADGNQHRNAYQDRRGDDNKFDEFHRVLNRPIHVRFGGLSSFRALTSTGRILKSVTEWTPLSAAVLSN